MFVKENPDKKKKKKERGLTEISKSTKYLRNTTSREYHTCFLETNVKHIGSLPEKWIEMTSLLGNTKILHPDARANKLVNYFTTVNT